MSKLALLKSLIDSIPPLLNKALDVMKNIPAVEDPKQRESMDKISSKMTGTISKIMGHLNKLTECMNFSQHLTFNVKIFQKEIGKLGCSRDDIQNFATRIVDFFEDITSESNKLSKLFSRTDEDSGNAMTELNRSLGEYLSFGNFKDVFNDVFVDNSILLQRLPRPIVTTWTSFATHNRSLFHQRCC